MIVISYVNDCFKVDTVSKQLQIASFILFRHLDLPFIFHILVSAPPQMRCISRAVGLRTST
ncbi:hypothetical protein N431DRAFT_125876 [Stipitochalara longipes BDJ]|nr:hypothetical protein N431DRAFT_125876 [Stipitochalara longipes BDJ]